MKTKSFKRDRNSVFAKTITNMKSSTKQFILVSLLVLASFCSYTYLNMVSIEDVATSQPKTEKIITQEEAENENQEIFLPDVELIKKVLETSKKVLAIATGMQ